MAEQHGILDQLGEPRRPRARAWERDTAGAANGQIRRLPPDAAVEVEEPELKDKEFRVVLVSPVHWFEGQFGSAYLRTPSRKNWYCFSSRDGNRDGFLSGNPSGEAAETEKWLGKWPKFLLDYYQANYSTVKNTFRLLIDVRDAMEISSRSWTPKREDYSKQMMATKLMSLAID